MICKGRILRQSPKATSSANDAAQFRLNRRNHAKQAQIIKRSAIISATRIFNGVNGAPRIVAVIPLTQDVETKIAVSSLAEALNVSADDCPEDGLWKMRCVTLVVFEYFSNDAEHRADRFKTSLQFRTVAYGNFYTALDACKVADYVLFVLSSTVEVDSWGDTLLRTLQAQGLPEVVTVVSPNESLDSKTRISILKSLLSFIQYFAPSQTKVFDLHVSSDRLNALRALSEGKPTDVRWRQDRSWILGESTEWEDGTLKLTGVVRGASLSPNRLIHIPNFGDYQISQVIVSLVDGVEC